MSRSVRVAQSAKGRLVGSVLALIAGLASGVGCAPTELTEDGLGPGGTGTVPTSTVVSCKVNSDCMQGETCSQGLCQMERCAGSGYNSSAPPLGKSGYVMLDRELVTSIAGTNLPVYDAEGSSVPADPVGSLSASSTPVDVAGGNLTGTRPEQVAYVDGSSTLSIVANGGVASTIDVGFPASFVATGDIDGDGIAEILVAGGGQYAVCSAVGNACNPGTESIPGTLTDIAMADVDGDGYADPIFLVGAASLVVILRGQPAMTLPVPQNMENTVNLTNITAGDLDGDGVAELVGKHLGGPLPGDTYDELLVYDLVMGQFLQQAELDLTSYAGYSLDITFATVANSPRVAVLLDGSTVGLYSYVKGTITPEFQTTPPTLSPGGATRITAADIDGNSPTMNMIAGPALQAGPAVPIAVLTLPPYSATHSSGPSSATMGTDTQNGTSSTMGSSESTNVSLTVGYGGGAKAPGTTGFSLSSLIPIPGFSAYFSAQLSWSISHSQSTQSTISIGKSYSITANPTADGFDSAAVVMACGCYHQYDYALDDPANMLGQNVPPGATVSVFVPVGGQTMFWSSHRYNALASALGGAQLPTVNIGYKLGDVSSYPTSPSTLDGKPIPNADSVFPSPPIVQTSDVGQDSFSLSTSQSTTNTSASSYNYGGSAQVGASLFSVFSVQGSVGQNFGLDKSYGVTVGSSTSFQGSVGPIHDDPNEPGDDTSLYGYSFQPFVYLQHFDYGNGDPGAYYVLTYDVTQNGQAP